MLSAYEDASRSDRRHTVEVVEVPGARHVGQDNIIRHRVRE
jgi:hypothetical protein